MRVDGHVHFHHSHSIELALDSAARNFARRPGCDSDPDEPLGMLWLVETAQKGAAERLRKTELDRWELIERDATTWELRCESGRRLVLVRGRQIATSERLEVLLVGTSEPVPDGRSLTETIEPWLEREVLVMLPWSFGKWTGARGRAVARAYEMYGPKGLRLADTGLRPTWLPVPDLLRRTAGDGHPVYVGSDPLPFGGQATVVGSVGFELEEVPGDAIWQDMYPLLRDLKGMPSRFGSAKSTASFLSLQARMQLRKHFGGRRA